MPATTTAAALATTATPTTSSKPTTHMKVVFGSMTFGKPGTLAARVHDPEIRNAILDTFQAHGHNEVDSARVYGHGSCEQILADLQWEKRGLIMDTKLYPNKGGPMAVPTCEYTLHPSDVRRGLFDSLAALKADKIDMFYLHGPDREHPLVDTLREVNELHKEGKFARFGISNFMSWEVAQMSEICAANGWVKPVVYQGIYNALHRKIEDELLPCLRYYGIALYAFQPLAGGFLTSRYKRQMGEDDIEPGSRFDPKGMQGKLHQGRYWNDEYFDGLEGIREAAARHDLTEAECALRWLEWHSQAKTELGDAVIVGASSAKQLDDNLLDLEKGPLPQDVLEAMEKAWMKVKGLVPKYWH